MVFILVIVSNTTRFQTRDPKVRKYLSEKCIALLCNFKKKINPILMELFCFFCKILIIICYGWTLKNMLVFEKWVQKTKIPKFRLFGRYIIFFPSNFDAVFVFELIVQRASGSM
jgi:hypothetical protein